MIETPTDTHLGALLGDVKELVIDMMRERLEASGFSDIRPSHGCVFRFIDSGSGSRLTDLADQARMTKQAVGEVVTELERLGYVKRTPDPTDGRAKIVRLTERGGQARQAARQALASVDAELAERVGERRIVELRESLAVVAASR